MGFHLRSRLVVAVAKSHVTFAVAARGRMDPGVCGGGPRRSALGYVAQSAGMGRLESAVSGSVT